MGGFRAAKIAKVLPLSVDLDLRVPPLKTLVPRNPAKTGGVAFPWARLVLRVDGRRNVTEVFDPVITLVAVNMVDLILRPHAIEMQPCQAMRFEWRSVDHDADVAAIVDMPSGCARLDTSATHPPAKDSRVGVVVQQASQGFGGGAFHF